jgi:two-component system KDP operon response regulator KdpE
MSNRKNILLIVDDEPSIQKMLTLILEEEEFKIVGTASGRQAIRLCASIKPDLILLDLGLPDMPGTEVITALREWSQVPIIVLSACAKDTAIVSALNLGANDYVTKPFSTDVLLARINACLRTCAIKELGEPHLSNGPVRMDLVRHEVYLREVPLALTPKEYDLLRTGEKCSATKIFSKTSGARAMWTMWPTCGCILASCGIKSKITIASRPSSLPNPVLATGWRLFRRLLLPPESLRFLYTSREFPCGGFVPLYSIKDKRRINMLNYIVVFFILAVIAAFLGFGGLAASFAGVAKILALVFVILFVASLVYSVITGRRTRQPLL